MITTSKDRGGLRRASIKIGDGLGGDVPVAAVLELGDSQGASLGRIGLEVEHVVDDQLVSRHLSAGGVVDDVLADLDRP